MQVFYSPALFRKRRRAVSGAWVWSMCAGSRCWQERAERLSEGLWSFASRYEEIKRVKCHGLIKAGADFCGPVSCATLIKKSRWKCRLSAQLWVCPEELWVKADKSFLKWFNWDTRARRLLCVTSCVCLGGFTLRSSIRNIVAPHMMRVCSNLKNVLFSLARRKCRVGFH